MNIPSQDLYDCPGLQPIFLFLVTLVPGLFVKEVHI